MSDTEGGKHEMALLASFALEHPQLARAQANRLEELIPGRQRSLESMAVTPEKLYFLRGEIAQLRRIIAALNQKPPVRGR